MKAACDWMLPELSSPPLRIRFAKLDFFWQ